MTDHRIRQALWLSYIFLLAVLLPHTAWAFSSFEAPGYLGLAIATGAAVAFELAIAALTYRLSKAIEDARRKRSFWRRHVSPLLNAYSVGLLLALVVSAAANLAHAVEFGQELAVFARWNVDPGTYAVLFGGVLPVTSLLFAFILAGDVPEAETDPALLQAREQLADARKALRQSERERAAAEQRAQEAETRFTAAGDLFAALVASEKRTRILAARNQWPQLAPSAIAAITEASPSYVSEVLKDCEYEVQP